MSMRSVEDNLSENIRTGMRLTEFDTQNKLAKASGVSQTFLSLTLNDSKSMSITRVAKLARAFRVPPWAMLLPSDLFEHAVRGQLSSLIEMFLVLDDVQRESVLSILRSLSQRQKGN